LSDEGQMNRQMMLDLDWDCPTDVFLWPQWSN